MNRMSFGKKWHYIWPQLLVLVGAALIAATLLLESQDRQAKLVPYGIGFVAASSALGFLLSYLSGGRQLQQRPYRVCLLVAFLQFLPWGGLAGWLSQGAALEFFLLVFGTFLILFPFSLIMALVAALVGKSLHQSRDSSLEVV